jgi:16S rRNA (uracil1498-N3)-methyltransferase
MATLHRIYCSSKLSCATLIQLPQSQSLHIKVVLRMNKGGKLVIFNESNGSFLANIEESKNLCNVFLEKFLSEPEKLKPLIFGIPLIKKHRFNFILESATQLGATKIVPVRFDRGQTFDLKEDKILNQVISSVEQCGRHTVPEISKSLTLEEFIRLHNFIVCANEKSVLPLNEIGDFIASSDSLAILVGPEGGFSENEQKLLSSSLSIKNISLGNFILRSETAVSSIASQIKLFY